MVVEERPSANALPTFPKEDYNDDLTQEDGSAENPFVRSVDENESGAEVGGAVAATDEAGDPSIYTLGGDTDSFKIDRESGQISTKVELDYEMQTEHMVTVTATDPSLASTMVYVMIMVNDKDDKAEITFRPADNVAPMFADDAETDFMVYENMDAGAEVGTVTADDPGDTLTYSDDSMYFDVDGMGNITTTMMLDHEAMASHTVIITATDSEDATASITVTVAVGNGQPGCDSVGSSLVNDCEALLDAKGDLGGDLNWDAGTAMAEWDGVTMSGDPMRVTALDLEGAGLEGSISAALGRLSAVTRLHLRTNPGLTGEIPDALGNLSYLTYLNLHSNGHTGPIPDLSGASMLEKLYLANNDLDGGIPASLNGLTNLTQLWLWGNQLTGGIPDLSALTSLDKLKLAGNMLDGNINAMYLPPNVTWLIIDSNGFDGEIPDLSGLTSLKLLWLHSNALTGAIPDGTMLPPNVDDLNLRDNMLSGEIPDLSALDMATRVRLHGNMLTGEVPATLGDLDMLQRLWLWDNELTSINAGLGDLSNTLIVIGLNGNNWDADACVPIALADVATNDYGPDNIEVCVPDDGS